MLLGFTTLRKNKKYTNTCMVLKKYQLLLSIIRMHTFILLSCLRFIISRRDVFLCCQFTVLNIPLKLCVNLTGEYSQTTIV